MITLDVLLGAGTVLGAACATIPVVCFATWKFFGGSFLGGISNAPLSSTRGFVAVTLCVLLAVFEYFTFLGCAVIPQLLDGEPGGEPVTGFNTFFQQAPWSIERTWAALPRSPVLVARWVAYNAVFFLWVVSYVRAIDTKSDALFTIDRQLGEVICQRCSRLKHRHSEHCAYCWVCADRFDHHSFLVNNCVAERNSKFYTLTLVYGCLRPALTIPDALLTAGRLLASSPVDLLAAARGWAVLCWLLTALWTVAVIGFLLLVWWVAVSWGFNTSTFTGHERGEGQSIEVLAAILEMFEWPTNIDLGVAKVPSPLGFPVWLARIMSRDAWERQLELPSIPAEVRRKNWRRLMGKSGWWWPSSPYHFPEFNNSAFVFKKAW